MSKTSFLYGVTPVQQCLQHNNRDCFELYLKTTDPKSPRLKEILKLAQLKNVPIKKVDPHKLGQLCGTKHHQGVVLSCSDRSTLTLNDFLESDIAKSRHLLVALDQLEDPQNVGAIIRSAAFLGASAILTLKKHSAPLSPTVSKASAGALEHFPIIEVTNLSETLQTLKKQGYLILGATLEEDSLDFQTISKTEWMVLVLGNEGSGLRNLTIKRCDQLVHIPGKPNTESLNVSAAAAILIQHFCTGN